MTLNTQSRHIVVAVSLIFVAVMTMEAQSRTPNSQWASADQTKMKLQPLDIKPGQWETTTTYKTSGELPIPAGMIDKLSAEQRARLEQRMKADSSGKTSTETSKSCVTKKDLEKSPDFGELKGDCTYRLETSTSTAAVGKYKCASEGMNANGAIDIEVVNQGQIKGTSHGTVSASGRELQLDSSFTSRWVGTSCSK